MRATSKGHRGVAKLLLGSWKADTNLKNPNGKTALMLAIENGHESMVDLLLACGVNPDLTDLRGRTALMIAVLN
jgi:ankyrin repeat protein